MFSLLIAIVRARNTDLNPHIEQDVWRVSGLSLESKN